MVGTDPAHGILPFRDKPGAKIAFLGAFQVRGGGFAVLTLAGIDDAHGLSAPQSSEGELEELVLLYIMSGHHLLRARLLPANRDARTGAWKQLASVVMRPRAKWSKVRIIARADSGFCPEGLLL